jgi:hypothetical protein
MLNSKHIIGIVILTFFAGIFYISDRTPYADEYVYLGHANSIYKNQVFGVIDVNTGESTTDARFAPLYPAFVAGIMFIDTKLADSVQCYLLRIAEQKPDCSNNLYTVKVVQLIIFSLLLAYCWYLLLQITASKIFSYACIVMIIISGAPYYYADHFLTESLYLGPAFIFLLTLSLTVLKKSIKYAVISACSLGVVSLIRPTYLYLFYFIILLSPILYFYKDKYLYSFSDYLRIVFTFIISFYVVVGPWIVRNQMYFDRFSITTGYGDKPLSTRVAHNEMTNTEYLAGWIYWLPDFGDSLARKLFGNENTDRLSFTSPDSFYPVGRQKVNQEISEAMSTGKYQSRMEAIFKIYIFSDLLNHAKVTMLMAWRGFFVEKYFGFIGLFVMIWAFVFGFKDRQKDFFCIILIPTIILLFFQAAISVSITRYNLILIVPFSFAYAALINKLVNLFIGSKQKI